MKDETNVWGLMRDPSGKYGQYQLPVPWYGEHRLMMQIGAVHGSIARARTIAAWCKSNARMGQWEMPSRARL